MNFGTRNFSRIVNLVILNRIHTVIAIVIFIAIAGCRSDDPAKALPEARSMFNEVLTEFNAQREKVKQEFEEGKNTLLTFKEAIKAAQDKDVEFAKVYTKWKRIEAEVKQIHEKFANLVSGADTLYAELKNRANSITDNQLKTKTLNSLKESKENYLFRLKQSRNSINKFDDVNTKVRDTMTALEINYTLDVLEEKLAKTFQEIDTLIESVMKELEELSRESKLLLNKRFG